MKDFDPDRDAVDGNLFGLPHNWDEARVIAIPVPWEATVSYGTGTSRAPARILEESGQIDLWDFETGDAWQAGAHMQAIDDRVLSWNDRALAAASSGDTATVNELSERMNQWVTEQTQRALEASKIPAIVGGEHSVSYGAITAACGRVPDVSILHIDAHADLRDAYQGYDSSHASVLFNVLRDADLACLTQVAIRDVSKPEMDVVDDDPRVHLFTDFDLNARYEQATVSAVMQDVVDTLTDDVWVTFDIDGLDPSLCPATGTPVPGGLSWREAMTLLRVLGESGRRIVGFDLVEVGDGTWDANVGARVLFKLVGWACRNAR